MHNVINRSLQNAYSDGAHFLIRLYYVSQANDNTTAEELKQILEQAKENNKKKGITGALIFNKRYFLQVIEGSRPAINDLFTALVQDGRHHNVQVVSVKQVISRNWVEWDMNYFSPSALNTREFMCFSPTPVFNPYLMSAEAIEGIFTNLSKNQYEMVRDTSPQLEEQATKANLFSLLNRRGGK